MSRLTISPVAQAAGDTAERYAGLQRAIGKVPNLYATIGTHAPLVLAQVLALARQLRSGELKTPDDATQELVSGILREKVRLQSKLLTDRIVQQLKDDPRLSKTLERLWKQAENQE